MREMFCFQCQQTAHNTGCDGKAGVCGKKADTANYQDELIGALIGLTRAARAGTPTPHTDELILKGLFTTITNVNFNNETILQCKAEIEKEKAAVGPGQLDDYDLAALWAAGEDVRSLKSLILFGLKGMAAYAYHARALGRTDPAVNAFFYEALEAIGAEKTPDELLALVLKTGEVNLACMALLDAAKAEADKAAADANAAGMIQTNLRAKEVKESEADAEIARQKKMVDLAAQEAEVQQRKLDAEVRKQADAELYRRQKEAEAQKYEAERAAEAAKFAKQQEAEGIALVGKAEAEAIRQKGLAEAEAMKQKAEAYKQYNDAAVAEMMIKVLPEIARSVAQPLSSIDKVSIIGGDASGVSGVSGNVPVLMAQTMEAMKEATGIDMRDIVRANSIKAKTDRNITIKTEPEGEE